MESLTVLFATSELFPLVKTGGLADVSYALPKALRKLGVDIRIITVGYPAILQQVALTPVQENLNLLSAAPTARLLRGTVPNSDIPLYVLDCPSLYQRDGGLYQDSNGYDWGDNALRFALLSRAAAYFGEHRYPEFKPKIIHCNDWQTGLTPAYLAFVGHNYAKVLMSLHNVAYQGVFGADQLYHLDLPPHSFNIHGLEYHGLLSFLKAGIYYANWVSTVSPTYATEIQNPHFGYGLAGLLAARNSQLTGILNGIDAEWHPAHDPLLPFNYSIQDLANKAQNKKALREKLGLTSNPNAPIISMITRLTYQKGIDLVLPIIGDIIREGAHLVILGSGDRDTEGHLRWLATQYPQQLSVTIGYDEQLAHLIEAGSDLFLMPSRFEPCGLNQMYSLCYGTLPVVRRTGGLSDTVTDTLPSTVNANQANGFVFEEEHPRALLATLQKALLVFRDKKTWLQLQLNGMQKDFSWQNSARAYQQLYQQLL